MAFSALQTVQIVLCSDDFVICEGVRTDETGTAATV